MNVLAINTQTLTLTESLAGWSALYDLSAGALRAQLRPTAASPLLLYEWATPNAGGGTGGKGRIDLVEQKAVGRITFYQNPAVGDVVTFGSRAITFVSGTPGGFQVQVKPTRMATISALRDLLVASSDADLAQCTYDLTASTLIVRFKTPGFAGNAFEIGATGEDVALSGLTLSEGGHAMTLSAPLAAIQSLRGMHALDVRYERTLPGSAPIAVVLASYSLTFAQGVTR